MLVRYWMTPSPYFVSPSCDLDQAFRLFREKNIRRLVVLDNRRLVGILSLSDLFAYVSPSSLLKVEISTADHEVLVGRKVADNMTSKPLVCDLDDHIEDVGNLMRERKVGALPVVRESRIKGIITESDVLTALTEITGRGSEGTRVCIICPLGESTSVMRGIFLLCEQFDMELFTVLTHPVKDRSYKLCMLRVKGSRSSEFIAALWKNNYQVLQVGDLDEKSNSQLLCDA